jgi:hypothetical protein
MDMCVVHNWEEGFGGEMYSPIINSIRSMCRTIMQLKMHMVLVNHVLGIIQWK